MDLPEGDVGFWVRAFHFGMRDYCGNYPSRRQGVGISPVFGATAFCLWLVRKIKFSNREICDALSRRYAFSHCGGHFFSQVDPTSHEVVKPSVDKGQMLMDQAFEAFAINGAPAHGLKINSFRSGDFDDADPFSICRSYDYTAEASFGPLDQQGRPMILIWRGRVCIHNDLNIVTNISYMESRLPDEAPFPQFEQEAETFLNGFWKRY